jgi:sterol desaturase/sphingolipid hydroxylase (fatty acid hydroxylase superfamily)
LLTTIISRSSGARFYPGLESAAMATTIAQAVVLVLGLLAGRMWPRESRPGLLTRESWINLANGAALFPIRYGIGLMGVYGLNLGLVPLGRLGHPALQVLFVFLALDITRYWVHRLDHRVPLLWSFHRVHHSCEQLDSTAGLRMHVVDFLQLTAIPVILFGVIFDISAFEGWVLPAALTVGIVADAMEHANARFVLDTPFRRVWFAVFNNPLFHSWHHTRDGAVCDGNYANALPLWDRLFGTDVTRPVPPPLYGLEDGQALQGDLFGLQLLRPRTRG